MIGTSINAGAIIAGSLLGLILKKRVSAAIGQVIMQGIGLVVCVMGLTMAFKMKNPLIITLGMVFGIIIGETLRIEDRLQGIGNYFKSKLKKNDSDITKGFVTASLIFCVGAMAITGAIEEGLRGDYSLLLLKATLDGITSVVLASTMGVGVAFSAAAVFIYQGSITLIANYVSAFLNQYPGTIDEMTSLGGILIMAIGINMLELRDKPLRIGNMLPAIFVAPLLVFVQGWLTPLLGKLF